MFASERITSIDTLIARGGRFAPHWGWHDDHRMTDGTPEYRPALQQVRAEYHAFLGILGAELNSNLPEQIDGACLQLGLGETLASHEAWRLVFDRVVTLDWSGIRSDDIDYPGVDVASQDAVAAAKELIGGQYDLLFIDAGHSAEDARRDHANYGPMVRPGGIIAFHDALRRPGFEEAVQVWRYLETLREPVRVIGDEVGIAWIKRAS